MAGRCTRVRPTARRCRLSRWCAAGAGVNDFSRWTDLTLEAVKTCQRAHGPELWPPPDTGHCDADVLEGVAAGLYHNQLAYWFKEFQPSKFLVTSLDAYEHNVANVLRDIASFIGASKLAVSNGRSAFSKSLAEYALMAMLHFNKQVPRCQQNRLDQKWDKFTMDVIEGKTVGFVGYGSIAQHTAKLAKAFGMRSVALRRNPEKAKDDPEPGLVAATYGLADAATLYAQADFVVCSLPGTAATTNFINAAAFAAMKPTSVFISLGRGAAVDEAALHHALTTGQIAGAALDVYKQEPLPAESPLWGCDNVLMTAHNADLTADYFSLGWKVWLENLAAYRSSATLATPVNTAEGY